MTAGIVEKALSPEPERLLEDWGDVVDPREPFNDSPEFGLSPNVTYYSQLRDRADGRFLPVYDHEMDLRHIRAMAWLLSERVPMAQAWVNRLLDYTIGTGFDWTITHDNPQLQKECNRAIVDATDNSRWTSDLERESYTREIVDGEWLSELEVDAGQIRIVTREADELTEPANKPAVTRWIADDESDFEKKSWTFGVLTNSKSTEIPIGYHFVRTVDGTDWDYCDASTVTHWKRNVRAKAKRGVSDFYKPHLYLMRADRVLTNTAEGAATQAAIAYIVEHPEKATQSNVKAIAAKYAPETGRYDPKTGEAQRKRRMAPNTRIDTPAGAKYHASLMGGNSSNIYIAVMESALRLAGTVHAFPEGMLTGSYQNANYASSLTAESPFVQGRVSEQMHRAARVKEMFLKILKLACERGRFRHCGIEAWKDMAPGLNVEIQPAKVFPKNIKETTDALVIQKAQGWVDDKSAMTELGRDYDAVRLQQKLEKGQTPQQPGEVDPNASAEPASEQPSGIYSQISRQQWIRNGKAIQDVVGNLVNGTTTPVLASVMLSTLGLDKETAQAIVDDVQSRGQESVQECKKNRRSNLLDSREQRKHRLVEGGKGSGITGHTTPKPVRDYTIEELPDQDGAYRAAGKWVPSLKAANSHIAKLKKAHKAEDAEEAAKAAVRKAREIYDNPHMFTKAEYVAAMTKGDTVQKGNETAEQFATRKHYHSVKNEVMNGRDVDENVLKDYPEWIKPKSYKLDKPATFTAIATGGSSSFNNTLNNDPHYIDKDLVDMAYDGIHHSEHNDLHKAISTVRPDMVNHSQNALDRALQDRIDWAKKVAEHEAEQAALRDAKPVAKKRTRKATEHISVPEKTESLSQLTEGGKGSGITGHTTFQNKAAGKGRKTQAPAGKETTRLSYAQIMASKTPQQRAIFEKAKKEGVVIPPAWTEVVYHGKDENIKAEGRDLAGRKQRVEDKAFRQNLSNANNERIAKTLIPKMQTIRKKLKTQAASGDEESKVLYLITQSGFRIGGKGDGKSKLEAFGATTLQGQHVKVQGDTVHFNFPGKKGVQQVHSIKDPVIAKMIGTPKIGERVFKTTDAKVREKWQSEFGGEKVHDIRHAVATEVAQRHLFKMIPPPPKSQAERNAIIKASSIESARVLGNNPSQALSTYINPRLWTSIKVQE